MSGQELTVAGQVRLFVRGVWAACRREGFLKAILALVAGHLVITWLLRAAIDQGYPFAMAVGAYLVFFVLSLPLLGMAGRMLAATEREVAGNK